MEQNDSDTTSVTRKRFLKMLGSAGVASLAGCSGSGGGQGTTTQDTTGTTTTTKSSKTTSESKENLRVGFLSYLSGPIAGGGQDYYQGVELMTDMINEEGGVNGHKLDLIQADTQASPDTAIQRARQLTQDRDVDILIGLTTSASAKALAQFVKGIDTPLLFTAGSPAITKEECNNLVFRCMPNTIHYQTVLAEGVAQMTSDSVTRIAGMNPDYGFGHDSWEIFKREFKKRRPEAEFVNAEFPAFLKGEYKKEIQATLDAEPDLIHSALYSGDMIAFVKQAHQYDLFEKVPEFAVAAADAAASSLGDQWVEGAIGQNSMNWHWKWGQDSELRKFTERYVDKYGTLPTGFFSAGGLANAECLRAAVEQGGGINQDSILSGLNGLEFETAYSGAVVRSGDHQTFMKENPVGRYGPVEADIIPDRDVMGWTEAVTVSDETLKSVDQDVCDAF